MYSVIWIGSIQWVDSLTHFNAGTFYLFCQFSQCQVNTTFVLRAEIAAATYDDPVPLNKLGTVTNDDEEHAEMSSSLFYVTSLFRWEMEIRYAHECIKASCQIKYLHGSRYCEGVKWQEAVNTCQTRRDKWRKHLGTHKHSSAAGEGDTPLSPEINSLLPRIDFSKIEYHNTYFWVSWE